MSRSADISFRLIALQRKLVAPERLQAAEREARGAGLTLETVLLEEGDLEPAQVEEVARLRQRHGRACAACRAITFLLPRQTEANTACEHCGGALLAPTPPAGGSPAPRPPAGAQPRPPARPGAPRPSAAGPPQARPRPAAGPSAPRPAGAPLAGSRPGPAGPTSGRPPRPAPAPTQPPAQGGAAPAQAPPTPADSAVDAPSPARAKASEPAAPGSQEDGAHEPRGQDERARKLRQAGAGFGYEPQEPEPRPALPLGVAGLGAVALAGAGSAVAPTDGADQAGADTGEVEAHQTDAPVGAPVGAQIGAPIGTPLSVGSSPLGARPIGAPLQSSAPPPPLDPDDDARFRPPPEHVVGVVGLRATGAIPPRPLREDLPAILMFPLQQDGLAVMALGAFFLMLVQHLPKMAVLFALFAVAYPLVYLQRIVRAAMQGQPELPDWPDFDISDLFSIFLRKLAVGVACVGPCLLVLGGLVFGGDGPDVPLPSIGATAHKAAPGTPTIPPGSDCSQALFYTLDDEPIALDTGTWSVVGLLGRYTADDTGMDQMFMDMPTGYGAMMHGHQIYDLDRVGQALGPKVQVLAAYADPDAELIHQLWVFTDPEAAERREAAAAEGPADVGAEIDSGGDGVDTREQIQDSLDKARAATEVGARFVGDGSDPGERPLTNPFKALRLAKTDAMAFPGPLDQLRRLPAVVVIDPQGKVAREYSTGVYDEKLYADLKDLMAGGEGDAWPETLPAHARGLSATGSAASGFALGLGFLLAFLLLVAGLFYLPMALLMTVAFESATIPFQYPAGARAIALSLKDYLVLGGLIVGIELAAVVFNWGFGGALSMMLPWYLRWLLVTYVATFVSFYGMVVAAHGIGRYYRNNEEALGWFTRPGA